MRDSTKLGLLAILIALGAFSWEWGRPSMITYGVFSQLFFQILAIICFVIAFIIGIWLMVSGRKEENRSKSGGVNITVDSRDFITKNTKEIKTIFDGLEKLIKINQEKGERQRRDKK